MPFPSSHERLQLRPSADIFRFRDIFPTSGYTSCLITYARLGGRLQMQAMTDQAKDLSETATKALTGSEKTPTKRGLSS